MFWTRVRKYGRVALSKMVMLVLIVLVIVGIGYAEYKRVATLQMAVENYRRLLEPPGRFPLRSFVIHEKVMTEEQIAFFKVNPGYLEIEVIEYDVDALMGAREKHPFQSMSTSTHGSSLSSLYEQLKERRLQVEEMDKDYLDRKKKEHR